MSNPSPPLAQSAKATRLSGDPIWEEALDWLLRTRERPDDAALHNDLETWLSLSDAHSRAYKKAEKVWLLSGAVELPETSPTTTVHTLKPRRTLRRTLLSGAVAACAFWLMLADWQSLTADHSSSLGENRQIELEDGSRIDLDSDSAVDVHFTAQTREIALRKGQAFFQVKSDPQRPFTVTAGEIEVTVTGTAFDVSLAKQNVAVAVAQGSVQVHGRGHPEILLSTLGPGERLRVEQNGQQVQHERMPVERVAAWRNGQLLVNDRPLGDVVEQLRRYYPGVILLKDKALAERHITAALNLHSPQQALQAAIAPLGGRLESWGPYLLIVSER